MKTSHGLIFSGSVAKLHFTSNFTKRADSKSSPHLCCSVYSVHFRDITFHFLAIMKSHLGCRTDQKCNYKVWTAKCPPVITLMPKCISLISSTSSIKYLCFSLSMLTSTHSPVYKRQSFGNSCGERNVHKQFIEWDLKVKGKVNKSELHKQQWYSVFKNTQRGEFHREQIPSESKTCDLSTERQ